MAAKTTNAQPKADRKPRVPRKPRAPRPQPKGKPEPDGLRVSCGVTMKVVTAPFENAEASLFLSNIAPGTTEEEMIAALETGKLSWRLLTERLRAQVAAMRGK